MDILTIFALINAIESLFSGFPGQGVMKKDVVMNAVTAIGTLAKIPTQTITTIGALVDGYVAVQNSLGAFSHGPRGDR
jgi:hypothetical protein